MWLKYLDIYTLHDKHLSVPEFYGYHVNQLDSIVEANKLRYVIIDSIFDPRRKKGIVVNQDPRPNTSVKKNRRIYLTINALQDRRVIFPNIYDLTLRQAVSKLKNLGLKIGELRYRTDLAKNKVLDFQVNGIPIQEGQELFENTVIDLIVGKGISSDQILVPNLIGLTRLEANIVLKSTSLNVGAEIFERDVKDSSIAIIYKQNPIGDDKRKVNIGSSIDIFYSQSQISIE